ncbi:hypothetical protein BMR11_13925 [Methylococcaceae bacterium CS5]|nr:hypothetical protein BMR11_13925 [Methylococcaceae bacterium CS5]
MPSRNNLPLLQKKAGKSEHGTRRYQMNSETLVMNIKNFNLALLLIAFFTTAHATSVNLALGKTATQSSNYRSDMYHAEMAVNGYTNSVNDRSSWDAHNFTHTKKEQGAWWQVDLGAVKIIDQIIIYNRQDCCRDRLSHYSVSIIDDNNNIVEKKDFNGAYPNRKKIIEMQGKKGRYVRIQLLNKNYLSLEEVQVMNYRGEKGRDAERFFTKDGNKVSMKENRDLVITGNIITEGYIQVGGIGPTCDDDMIGAIRYNGTIDILEFCDGVKWAPIGMDANFNCDLGCQLGSASSMGRYDYQCAIKLDNTVTCWGGDNMISYAHQLDEKERNDILINIAKTDAEIQKTALSNLKEKDKKLALGRLEKKRTELLNSLNSKQTVPDGLKAKQIALGGLYACALKLDESVQCWGSGHSNPPAGLVAKQISAGIDSICALKHDHTVQCWGAKQVFLYPSDDTGQNNVPAGLTAKQVTAGENINCALKLDDTIHCWGDTKNNPASSIPEGIFAKQIVLSIDRMCALKLDNSVACWGGYPTDSSPANDLRAKQITSGLDHACALKLDNTVECWGSPGAGGIIVPDGLIAKRITSGIRHTCALKLDNTVECWGDGDAVKNKPTNLIAKHF